MKDKKLLQQAYDLGAKAFKDGKMLVPAWDKEFLDKCLKNCQLGEGIPYLKKWQQGYLDLKNISDRELLKEL